MMNGMKQHRVVEIVIGFLWARTTSYTTYATGVVVEEGEEEGMAMAMASG